MTTDSRPLLADHVSPRSTPVSEPQHWRLRARRLWLIPGLAVAIYANAVAGEHGLGPIPLLAFAIVPHLTVLLGLGQPHAPGQMAARPGPPFYVVHHPAPAPALPARPPSG